MKQLTQKFGFGILAFALASPLTGCNLKAAPVLPTAEEQASLERLHKNCFLPASLNRREPGTLRNMPEMRKRKFYYTCDEMKQTCESDYASDMCKSMMLVASVENAMQNTCRSDPPRTTSPSCKKVTNGCNGKGFASPECANAIAPYNK